MAITRLQFTSFNNLTVLVFKSFSSLALGMLLVSCANDPNARPQASSDQVCVYVKNTGSNLPVKECRTRAERQALTENTREASEELFRQSQALDETGAQSLGADSLE